MMKKLSRSVDLLLGIGMASCLAAMSCLVFSNVILRYLFDSGITWSEEMSRYLFVFMIFLGTTRAMKFNQHLNVDIFIKLMPFKWLRVTLQLISASLMLYALWLLIDGSWQLAKINMNTLGPATNMPLWLLYAGAMIMGACMCLFILFGIRCLFENEQQQDALDKNKNHQEGEA
ncbi:TRAP transporter small permease [Marinomonas sp. A3A]|uniref:TRAP transporter small permease n=1 Tax=Marinomonas sp. A3A TaxID=2065312 RepID=UPI001BB4514F|nr:TRAP transporter small permease [Marinomonas sp. A3A]QUX92271.1 TRAP transporter small permease [Marinomonas sp. A3A]